jgi:hypothetical protein
MTQSEPSLWAIAIVAIALGACGNAGSQSTAAPAATKESVYCCALQKVADACTTAISSQELRAAAQQWRSVGTSGNAEACKALVDTTTIGCVGPSPSDNYDIQDGIAACAR